MALVLSLCISHRAPPEAFNARVYTLFFIVPLNNSDTL